MTSTTPAARALRLPLLAAMTVVFALTLALALAAPLAASEHDEGFEPTGEGFIDADAGEAEPAEHDEPGQPGEHGDERDETPVGGVDAGFGGMAADDGGTGLGASAAVGAGLLVLGAAGVVAHRRRGARASA